MSTNAISAVSVLLAAIFVGMALYCIPHTVWVSDYSVFIGVIVGLLCGLLVRLFDYLISRRRQKPDTLR